MQSLNSAADLKEFFLLDPSVIFLNHGSFGACPKPVFLEYQRWQFELERQPVEFLARRATALMAEARAKLADYVGAAADELIYYPNPTHAINMVARSLALQPGDEILTSDQEYGAMDRTWHWLCKKVGAKYVHRSIPLPVTTSADFVEHFWRGVNERTKVIFISHLASPTALIFPVQALCKRAREQGILTIIDGAHVPGHLPLNLHELGCDIYTGACHKWLSASKGAAFLYERHAVQSWLEPLVVSWGWGDAVIAPTLARGETQFIRNHEWQGTRDLAAFLSVPSAIEFQKQQRWDDVRTRCHTFAAQTRQRINALTGLDSICPDSREWFNQMVTIRIPRTDLVQLKTRLYNEFKIEAPLIDLNNQHFIRVSYQGYNTEEDMNTLIAALEQILPDGS
ncbi:MAG: aminotransferase class V-fold PLP-dependent enzyme [Gammaproteobacteria bacterium]|nr:aminotransferase class V-fold PLP-dependent enzyme [Gammaproteobacteria bacterium]